eukprot:SAG22_NODE_7727_length_713_cov_2.285016_2_plen_109_part_00
MQFVGSSPESQRRWGTSPAWFMKVATNESLPGDSMEQATLFLELDFSVGVCESVSCSSIATRDICTKNGGFHVCVGCAAKYRNYKPVETISHRKKYIDLLVHHNTSQK